MSHGPGFEYVGRKRGAFARLKHPKGHEVICTEHPETLLSLRKLGLLSGEAKADAEALYAQLLADL